jgi:hypothetical protein
MSIPPFAEWPMRTRLAGVALVVGLALDVAALVRARSSDEEGASAPLEIQQAPRAVVELRADADVMRAALARTPFDVTAPVAATPYVAMQQSEPVAVRPRLVGTVVEGRDGGFVIVEKPDGQMQLVRIGERTGDLRLRAVSANSAVFEDAQGSRVPLRTPAAGPETRP